MIFGLCWDFHKASKISYLNYIFGVFSFHIFLMVLLFQGVDVGL